MDDRWQRSWRTQSEMENKEGKKKQGKTGKQKKGLQVDNYIIKKTCTKAQIEVR